MIRTILLQALPEEYAGTALELLARKIEDMQTKLGQRGDIPVDQIENIIRESFGILNEETMHAFILKNIDGEYHRGAAVVAGSRASSVAQFFVRLVAFIAFSYSVPRNQALQIANRYARGATQRSGF